MPLHSTPARRKRDAEKLDKMVMRQFEDKFTEFSLGCDEGLVDSCHSLGEWWAFMRKDFEKARYYYEDACTKHSHKNSCFNLAALYGKGVAKDTVKAMDLFYQSCRSGNGQACDMVGPSLLSGASGETKPDPERARYALETACYQHDYADSCSALGIVYLTGREGFPRDPTRGVELLQRGCDGDDVRACANLSLAYANGDGVPKDLKKADEAHYKMVRTVKKRSGRYLRLPPPSERERSMSVAREQGQGGEGQAVGGPQGEKSQGASHGSEYSVKPSLQVPHGAPASAASASATAGRATSAGEGHSTTGSWSGGWLGGPSSSEGGEGTAGREQGRSGARS